MTLPKWFKLIFGPAKIERNANTHHKREMPFLNSFFRKSYVSALPGRHESVTFIFINLNESQSCG